MGPRAGEQEGRMGARAGEQEGRMGARAGEHEGHMGPRAGVFYRSLVTAPARWQRGKHGLGGGGGAEGECALVGPGDDQLTVLEAAPT